MKKHPDGKAKSPVTNVALGSIQTGPFQFVRQYTPDNPNEHLEVVLPGQIIQCNGRNALLSILPYARVAVNQGRIPHHAIMTAQVLDESGLDQSMRELGQKVAFQGVDTFAVRLASDRHTVVELIGAAERAADGCGCEDCGSGGGTLLGSVEIGAAAAETKGLVWSRPVRATLKAWVSEHFSADRYHAEAEAAGLFFDCYSEWWIKGFWEERFTTCHGPCTGKNPCSCGKDKRGNRMISCPGWTFCTCL